MDNKAIMLCFNKSELIHFSYKISDLGKMIADLDEHRFNDNSGAQTKVKVHNAPVDSQVELRVQSK